MLSLGTSFCCFSTSYSFGTENRRIRFISGLDCSSYFTIFLALTFQILERQFWQVMLISSPPLIIAILALIFPYLFWSPQI
ncbi:MAG: hypothetical protein ACXACF_07610, partial [Candidatus Hermodarchaeia archaeon]